MPIGEPVRYQLGFVANARRFKAGHRIRLVLSSDDQDPGTPALLNFRHATLGTSSVNIIASSSRLLVPVMGPLAS